MNVSRPCRGACSGGWSEASCSRTAVLCHGSLVWCYLARLLATNIDYRRYQKGNYPNRTVIFQPLSRRVYISGTCGQLASCQKLIFQALSGRSFVCTAHSTWRLNKTNTCAQLASCLLTHRHIRVNTPAKNIKIGLMNIYFNHLCF